MIWHGPSRRPLLYLYGGVHAQQKLDAFEERLQVVPLSPPDPNWHDSTHQASWIFQRVEVGQAEEMT